LKSLQGLSVGDAFGELFFNPKHIAQIPERQLPPGPWYWTDDTNMALSIVDTLWRYKGIDQDYLASSFADRYVENPFRGYGGGAAQLLMRIGSGADWRILSPLLFRGGSYGNGSAMRIAPLGAFFTGDLGSVVEEAKKSAEVTHAHSEGQAGAIAVAVGASIAATDQPPSGNAFLKEIMNNVPVSEVRRGIENALRIPAGDTLEAVLKLGAGMEISCQDTVPFCLWCAAHNLDNYEEALWQTASGLGDVDTTCAIAGGIVALSCRKIPFEWIERREPLPVYLAGFMRDL